MAITRIIFLLRTISLLIMVFSLSFPVYAKYSGGAGEPNDPYQITTAEDLMLLGETSEDYDKHFVLTADIDLDPNLPGQKVFDYAVIAPEINKNEGWFSADPFTGVFDGNDHTISNLTIVGGSYLGLFGQLDDSAKVKNLILENAYIEGVEGVVYIPSSVCIGILAAQNHGTVTRCRVSGTVRGYNSVGGLTGSNGGDISDCESYVNVTGEVFNPNDLLWSGYDVGGLAGENGGTITFCQTHADVSGRNQVGGVVGENYGRVLSSSWVGTVGGHSDIAGLVGQNDDDGYIEACLASGEITGENDAGGLVGENQGTIVQCAAEGIVAGPNDTGGLVAENHGPITSCYCTTVVNGETEVGGLVADNGPFGIISYCYSTGSVSGVEDVGGLVGENSGPIAFSYSTGQVTGQFDVGGLVGENHQASVLLSYWDKITSGLEISAGGQGLTTEQMQLAVNFSEWGYGDQWAIDEEQGYPFLVWQDLPGEPFTEELGVVHYDGGTGEPNDPFQIATAGQLASIGPNPAHYGRHFVLTAHIDMSGTDPNILLPIGVIGLAFEGVFDGSGHTISHLQMNRSESYHTGLFGYIGQNAELRNLNLSQATVVAFDYAGTLAGASEGNIVSCFAGGQVAGHQRIGGLVGIVEAGYISDCHWIGDVNAFEDAGGIAGRNHALIVDCSAEGTTAGNSDIAGLIGQNNGEILQCNARSTIEGGNSAGGLVGQAGRTSVIETCSFEGQVSGKNDTGGAVGNNRGSVIDTRVTATVKGATNTGGLVGDSRDGFIKKCHVHGKIIGHRDAGGLVGENHGPITECSAQTTVTGENDVGGLVAENHGPINGCYALADVNGITEVGGLVGDNDGVVTSCYANGDVKGVRIVGGLIGEHHSLIYKCYSNCSVSGEIQVGGLVAFGHAENSFWDVDKSGITDSLSGIGKTTAEMQTASTFIEASWDFIDEMANGTEDIWRIDEGQDYPRLWWE